MSTIKLCKKDVDKVRTILKFRDKEKAESKNPVFRYLYLTKEGHVVMTDGSSLGAVMKLARFNTEGYYDLQGNTLVYCSEEIQKTEYPLYSMEHFLIQGHDITMWDTTEYITPENFCYIMSLMPETWINPELYLRIPKDDYNIGRFKMSKDSILETCPVVFQSTTFTFVIMPLTKNGRNK